MAGIASGAIMLEKFGVYVSHNILLASSQLLGSLYFDLGSDNLK